MDVDSKRCSYWPAFDDDCVVVAGAAVAALIVDCVLFELAET